MSMLFVMGAEAESVGDECLLVVELDQLTGTYANAFICNWHVVTAGHVASCANNPRVVVSAPGTGEQGLFDFDNLQPEHDLAISKGTVPIQGFLASDSGELHQAVEVSGHHGPSKQAFVIEATVDELLPNGRIVIRSCKNGVIFQRGMSGVPARTADGSVLGVLVEGVSGSLGEMAELEPITLLKI